MPLSPVTIVPQAIQQGVFGGLPVIVPKGAASVQVQTLMNAGDITTPGVVFSVALMTSKNFGATWSLVGIPIWYSGPQTGRRAPLAPNVGSPVIAAATHYSGLLNLTTSSNVGLQLSYFDALGNAI